MKKNQKNLFVVILTAIFIYGMSVFCLIKPDDKYSLDERRKLNTKPDISVQSIFDSKKESYMDKVEAYVTDQFPMRNEFRTVGAAVNSYLFFEKVQNDIYHEGKYYSKLEYVTNKSSIDWALGIFSDINKRYLSNCNVYMAIIPDKNYYLAEKNGYPAIDYEYIFSKVKNETMSYAHYIDITENLELEDFYYTDTHWRQEKIIDVAGLILERMGASKEEIEKVKESYVVNELDKPFYGVYCGQAALPIGFDKIEYVTNDSINNCSLTCYDSGNPESMSVYDLEKGNGNDSYEWFLSGARSLIKIENPDAKGNKKLIIFRDSFGSSIAPLLIDEYSEITLVDIRYISPMFLSNFIEFDGCDVLFLYSTMVINNSEGQLIK